MIAKVPKICVNRDANDGPYRVDATIYNLNCLQAAKLMELLDNFWDEAKRGK